MSDAPATPAACYEMFVRWLIPLALVAVSCTHLPPGTARLGEHDQLTVVDTLPPLITALSGAGGGDVVTAERTLLAYEAANAQLLDGASVKRPASDPRLTKLAVSQDALLTLLRQFEANAGAELRVAAQKVQTQRAWLPRLTLAFAVLRDDAALAHGTLNGEPLVVLNARSPAWMESFSRQAGFAQVLFQALHRERLPDSASLGELATTVWRDGAGRLATRVLVPEAQEQQVLAVTPEQLTRLREREALISKELLSALDSASNSEVDRFFDPAVKDPVLPRGAGPFIADRIYQRLAAQLGSTSKPLELSPTEFLARARPILLELSAPR